MSVKPGTLEKTPGSEILWFNEEGDLTHQEEGVLRLEKERIGKVEDLIKKTGMGNNNQL